jgi:hypothetical protein
MAEGLLGRNDSIWQERRAQVWGVRSRILKAGYLQPPNLLKSVPQCGIGGGALGCN